MDTVAVDLDNTLGSSHGGLCMDVKMEVDKNISVIFGTDGKEFT
jgi:hypothetical protein